MPIKTATDCSVFISDIKMGKEWQFNIPRKENKMVRSQHYQNKSSVELDHDI
jgi:hypothetical protein